MNRSGSFDARATLARDEVEGVASEFRLAADDPLHWEYTISAGGRETRWSCDGGELLHVTDGRKLRNPVPEGTDPDEPLYFSSWLAVVDTWLVEMVRPVDLLARVLVTSIEEDAERAFVRVGAEPLGNEPSPYNGFSVPDGRSLALLLDVDLGCLAEVAVIFPDGARSTHTLTLTGRAA